MVCLHCSSSTNFKSSSMASSSKGKGLASSSGGGSAQPHDSPPHAESAPINPSGEAIPSILESH